MGRVEPDGLEGLGSILYVDTWPGNATGPMGQCMQRVCTCSPGPSLSLAPSLTLLLNVVPTYLILGLASACLSQSRRIPRDEGMV